MPQEFLNNLHILELMIIAMYFFVLEIVIDGYL